MQRFVLRLCTTYSKSKSAVWFPSQMLHLKPHQKSLEQMEIESQSTVHPFSRVPLMITVVWFMFPPDWPNVKVAWKNAFGGLNAPVRRLRVFLQEPVFTSTYCDNSLFLASQTRKLTKQPRGAEWVELLVSGLWSLSHKRKLKEAASELGKKRKKKRETISFREFLKELVSPNRNVETISKAGGGSKGKP